MSKTTIIYKDIAPGAAEDAAVAASGQMEGSDPTLLPEGHSTPAIATLELNSWLLNGTRKIMDGDTLAFWSEELSGEDGAFANPPEITVSFDQQYTSTGISLEFDAVGGDYCSQLKIAWYQAGALLAEKPFEPDGVLYFCQENVTAYDQIVITLLKTALPYRRARLTKITFGRLREFGMTEIRNAAITHEMDLLALELPVSTMAWTLDSRENVEYMFQEKQPMEAWNGDKAVGVFYIDKAKQIGAGLYNIDCHDAFGVLDESPFAGGIYTDKSAVELLQEILGGEFELSVEVDDMALTGAILPCSKREAIPQVLFAWGVCASTDGRSTVRIFAPGSDPKEIGTDKTFLGASVETDSIVTKVIVTAHEYTEDSEGDVEIGGVYYKDTQTTYTVENPNVTATTKQRVVEVTDAMLVSPTIGQGVAQRVYDYYARRKTRSAKIVWTGERLGDCMTVPNAWGGTTTGNINRLEIKLSNTVVASSRSVGV